MFKKVLLVQPPSSSYLGAARPPTGLGYISQALQDVGIEHRVLDARLKFSRTHLESTIQAFQPDLIGLSVVSFEYKRTYELIRLIRGYAPQAAIVIGGHHISTFGGTVLEECPEIDYGITHEGERSIVQLCQGDAPESSLPGLIYRDHHSVRCGPPQVIQENLDSVRFPRYERFDLRRYPKEICIVTSRGCPYRCVFCPNSLTAKKFRARSPVNTVDEIEYWYSRGVRILNVDDDNFTLVKERVYKICDEIERRGMKELFIRCANGIRADRVDRPLLTRMKEVGFREIGIGGDGGNDRVLREVVRKGETLADIENAVRDALDVGLRVKLFIIVGLPGETKSDIEDSISLAQRYRVSWVQLNNAIPYPGTELYEWVKNHNAFITSPEQYLNCVTESDDEPVFETPELPAQTRRDYLVRCRKIEKEVKRRAASDMFKNIPVIRELAGLIFSSQWGQELFFKNVWLRSVIDWIWYRKMVKA